MNIDSLLKEDYYKLLGVGMDASPEEIKKAYKTKAKYFHPDCFPNNAIKRHKAEENFKKLLQAKDTLLNPGERQKYDESLHLYQDCCISYLAAIYSI